MKKLIAAFVLASVAPFVQAAAMVQVEDMRIWPAPDGTRIVFDVSGPVDYHLFRLEHPDRLVVDLKNAHLSGAPAQPADNDAYAQRVRHAVRNGRDLRVVFDLRQAAQFKSFLLKPNEEYGDRLVIDLSGATVAQEPVKSVPAKSAPAAGDGLRDLVIGIDAGHGGEDPGARGYSGVYEKDVVFAIARQLEALIKATPGMRPVMIRDGDYYVSLRDRTLKARQQKADLFVSIHADAFRDPRVGGLSLYVLSRNGASDEAARWLAEKENASDLIGGVSLDDKDSVLASVLLDLSQSATIEASYEAGTAILQQVQPLGRLHKHTVQQAGFVVLKSPDIPSLLIETAFISNPKDERELTSPRHQRALAQAILKGINNYFYRHAPAGTVYATTRRHIIARGDTLSDLAAQYRTSVARLRALNSLHSDTLRVGQVLRIPRSEDLALGDGA